MSVAIGRIRGGQVVVEGDGPLPEGRRVTVVIDDEREGFHLDEQSQRELREAMAAIDRGEYVTEEQLEADLDLDASR